MDLQNLVRKLYNTDRSLRMKQVHNIIPVLLQTVISTCRMGEGGSSSYASRDGCRKSRHHLDVRKSDFKIILFIPMINPS